MTPTSSDAPRRVVRHLRVLRESLDRDVRVRADVNAQPISCARGCAHCCDLVVLIDRVEAIALVHAYVEAFGREAFRERIWPRLVEAVDIAKRYATSSGDIDGRMYQRARLPCAFLELEARTCSVYRDRPVPCRTLLVLSAPEACAEPDGGRWHLDVSDHLERAYARQWEIGAREGVGSGRPAFGFLPDLVMRAARLMGAAPEDGG